MDANHLETKKNRTRCWERTNRLNQPNKIAKLSTRKNLHFIIFTCVCVFCVTRLFAFTFVAHLKNKTTTKNLASSWHRRTQHQHRHHPAEALGHAERALRQQRQCQRVQSQPKISLQEPVPEFPLEAGHLQGRSIRRRRRYRKQTKKNCAFILYLILSLNSHRTTVV